MGHLSEKIDNFIVRIGIVISCVYLMLVLVILTQVILRYGFNQGQVFLEELQWHLYAIGIMFGLSYSQVTNTHIRVDLIHMRLGKKTKSVIEIFGILFLLLPFIFVVLYHSQDFVWDSWRTSESSNAPSGLPWRWAIKSVIPVTFFLLLMASISRLLREVSHLVSGDE